VISPFKADAAAVSGDARYSSPPFPILPLKLRLDVDTHTSPSASTPRWEPRHGPQPGGPNVAPASIILEIYPLSIASSSTVLEAGMTTVRTATFSEPMDSSTVNNSTVKVYSLDKIVGETFEDTNGSWNSGNFQAFNHSEELTVWQTPIDDTHRTIGECNLTYSTHPLLGDYHVYSNEGIEVEDSGNYSVISWLGDENVVINSGTGDWIISKLVFEQNSTDTKTLHVGETWDLGDGYSIKLLNLDEDGKYAWIALNKSSGKIDDEFSQNQSAYIFSTDLGASDNTPIFVTYLNKVNLAQSHIELKYTWLISQETSEIQNNEQLGDFRVKTFTDRIIIENDEDMFLMRDSTIPLFYDFKFKVEDTLTVQYSLICQ
jgi:S-layer protein (TIGR01567 family)